MLSLCSIALCCLSCHGNIDPDQNGEGVDLPEGVDTTVNLASGYAKKMIAMQFTSTGCTYCPILYRRPVLVRSYRCHSIWISAV